MSNTQTQLYLISPLDVGGNFPQRLERALIAGKGLVTAFQFRVKGLDQHQAARLAAPLQALCSAHEVAFIVNEFVRALSTADDGQSASTTAGTHDDTHDQLSGMGL